MLRCARTLSVAAILSAFAGQLDLPIEVEAERTANEPLLRPARDWMSLGVFNPAAIQIDRQTILLFRAQDQNHTSRIGYAASSDGVHFDIRPQPVLSPEAPYEKNGGVEDPRIVSIAGTYYLTYTGYDTHSAQLCLATSKDLVHWTRIGVILPAYRGTWNTQWTKSGAILPQQVNGKWWMYYLGTKTDPDGVARDYMGLASSTDLRRWTDATNKPVLERRPGAFDSRVMEPGPAPFLTDAGILLLYNGANDNLVYGPGWALFDAHDPAKLIARAQAPFIRPRLDWEKTGNVPNVIFVEGCVVRSRSPNKIELTAYYGAADKYIGSMNVSLDIMNRN